MKNNRLKNAVGIGASLVVLTGVCYLCWRSVAQMDEAGVKPGKAEERVMSGPADASKPRDIMSRLQPRDHAEIDMRRTAPADVIARRETGVAGLGGRTEGVKVDFDAFTAAPKSITAPGRFLAGNDGTPPALVDAAGVVRRFVDANPVLFGHPSSALAEGRSRVTRDDTTAASGLKTLVWQQELDGIPLYNTLFRANLTKNGELVAVGSHYLADPEAASAMPSQERARLIDNPPVNAASAISLAAASVNDSVPSETIVAGSTAEGAERKQRFSAPKLSDVTAQMTWMPMSTDEVRLAWDVVLLSLSNNEMFRTVVDATSGEVLQRTSLTADISNATYRVYADSATLQPFDSPTPFSPGHSTPLTTQPPEVARQLVTTQAENVTASPNGWIDDGGTQTLGNNVDAHTDIDANNSADLPRPTSPTRVFDFTMSTASEPTTYRDAAVTQLFYVNNWLHDRLYAYGFTESAGNFQTNNFGRGGLGNDAVQADAQDGSGTNNANFNTPPDGSAGRMQMYVFPGPAPDRDGDFDHEIVIHEYVHGLSNRLVGGGALISQLQSAGMGEGWSDFYAMCMLAQAGDDPDAAYAAGGYATKDFFGLTQNYYYGIRRYPYSTDMLKNPLTFKDIDPTQASAHAGVPLSPISSPPNVSSDEVHNQGEVWCMALWEVRRNLVVKHGFATGNQLTLQLVTDAMKLCPVNPNFVQSRDAVVQADLVLTGGANQDEIWAGFAKRGLGFSATSPASSTTIGVVEAFDVPDDLLVFPVAPFAASGPRLSGPIVPGSYVYTLQNNGAVPIPWTAAKTQSWLDLSSSGGTLNPGDSTTVTATINASALSLPAAVYTDTVTFVNTVNSAVMSRAVTLDLAPYLTLAQSFPMDSDPMWSRQGQWAFGTPTGQGFLPDPTSGNTGTKVFGVALNGNYTVTLTGYEYLTTGPLNLTGMTGNHVRFARWLNCSSQSFSDSTFEMSTDGSSWTTLFRNTISAITESAWTVVTYPLGAQADNQSTVYLRWGHRVNNAGASARSGWNIDDVQLLTGSVNTAITAAAQTVETPNGTPVNITTTGTVTPSAPLNFALVAGPTHGTLTGTLPNVTYQPDANFYGADSFTFTVSNGTITSSPASVVILVAPGTPDVAASLFEGAALVDGGTVSFGDVYVGSLAVRRLVIGNTGSAPLNISSVTVDGAHAGEFSLGSLSATRLEGGQQAYLDVTFRPTYPNSKLAALHVTSDDPDESPFDIVFAANGTTPGGPVLLAKDIQQAFNGLSPVQTVVIGSTAYFLGTTVAEGQELWKTDGTAAGTVMVRDLFTGVGGSSISNLTHFNGTLFFAGNNVTSGTELMKSDGTSAGTVVVKDIIAGTTGSNPGNFTVVGSTLFFTANDSTNGIELWKTDGTTAGTVLVANIASGLTSSSPASLRNVGGTLFFTANNVTNGTELWKSDGTAAGTVLVKDIIAGATGAAPANLTAAGSTLFFTVNDGVNGIELWKSDGTAAGTVMVLDINPGSASSSPGNLVAMSGSLYFSATTTAEGAELWKSDGTAAGTVLVKDIFAGASSSTPASLTVVGPVFYFAASESTNGREIWKSDGTSAGTVLVRNLVSGSGSSSPSLFTQAGGQVYFSALTDSNGAELWKTDGTTNGTVLVKDVNFGSGSSSLGAMADLGGILVFSANDGLTGQELWRSDGTDPGTFRLRDGQTGTASAAPANLRNVNGTLYFSATDSVNGTELWRSDGTLAGTTLVANISASSGSSFPTNFSNIGGTLYFSAFESTNGTELWKSDGTAAGTVLVSNIAATSSSSSPANLTAVGPTLFFAATDTTNNGQELWKSDGTAAGTTMVLNINPAASTGSSLANLTDFNGTLFFTANDGTNGFELWKSDGTAAGTVLVKDINTGSLSSSPANLRVIGSTLYFTATTTANGTELWKSDGTAAGTVLVSDIAAGTTSSSPANLTVVGATLFFSASNGAANGTELWRSDGTAGGTFMVRDIVAGSGSSSPGFFLDVGGTLFFRATTSVEGIELWKSDGTAGGTVLVSDINPGPASSSPFSFAAVGGVLYMSATQTVGTGREIWRSDGTGAGTVLVADINPGAADSNPANLTAAGNLLFFTATAPDLGSSELFVINTLPPAEIVVEHPAGSELTDGVDSVYLGSAGIGGDPVSKTFLIKNTGTQSLTVTGITIDGPDAASFSVPGFAGAVIGSGGSQAFTVTLLPGSLGAKTAALHIGSTDGDENPFDVALSGDVVNMPEISVEQPAGTVRLDGSSTVSFGDAVLGVPVVKTFRLRNTGTASMAIISAFVDGPNFGDFVLTPLTGSVPAGSFVDFDITFAASAVGARAATLRVSTDDADEGTYDIMLVGIGSAPAGALRLAGDINKTGAGPNTTSLVVFGGSAYFAANTQQSGTELWKTDGTAAGTVMVKDIATGLNSSSPTNLVVAGGTLYFAATNSTNGIELWKSDGTSAGTVMVKDIFPGSTNSSPVNLTDFGGTLFFSASDSTANGTELWKSDGTSAGTVLVANINTTANTGSSPASLTVVGSTLFFTANGSATTQGVELWKSDGTTAGTVLVRDINAGSASSSPGNLLALGPLVLFSATDTTNGTELWLSDGTTPGTFLVKDINAGTSSSSPASFLSFGGAVYFRATTATAGAELWRTDGSAGGTYQVKDISPGTSSSSPSALFTSGPVFLFSASDGVNGIELWRSDGTDVGTVLVKDINAGTASSIPSNFKIAGGVTYFNATTVDGGIELWRTDGTAANTVRVLDVNPGTASSSPGAVAEVGGRLLFVANDGTNGAEIWATDGTSAGTSLLIDIVPGTGNASPSLLTSMNGTLYFSAFDNVTGTELWKADGVTGAPSQVKDILTGLSSSSPASVVRVGSTLYFAATDTTNGAELWKSDGTAAGTVLVKNINPAAFTGSAPANLTAVGTTLFFQANDGTNGLELWKSDGTDAGTVMVANINPAASTGSAPANLTAVGTTLFFQANDGTNGVELWKSDGTTAGTVLVKDINVGSVNSSPANLRAMGSVLYFAANTAANGTEIWKSDGTAAGTVIVSDIVSGATSSSPGNLTVVGSSLFFSAFFTGLGTELWKSDGTAAGTVQVKDIFAGTSSSSPSSLLNMNGTLFFSAADSTNGAELWKSDGTAAGTVLVKDINPGTASSSPFALVDAYGVLYFRANTAANGIELWKSDGTAAGTVLAADIFPGAVSSSLLNPAVLESNLFFSATGQDIGTELWMYDLGVPEIAVKQPLAVNLTTGASSIAYGGVNVGSSQTKTFMITNTARSGSLTGLSVGMTGDDPGDFVPAALGSGTLAAGGSVTLDVTFTPLAGGARNAVLQITSNDPDEPVFEIALTGDGLVPEIAVEHPAGSGLTDGSATVPFGNVPVTGSATREFTIRNTGGAPLGVTNVSVTTGNAGDFAVNTAGMLSSVPAGGSTTFSVSFVPGALGPRATVLQISSTDTDEAVFDVTLSGNGITQTTNPVQSVLGDVVTGASAPDAGGAADGTQFNMLLRGGFLAQNGTLVFPGELEEGFGGVDSTNFQGIWKQDGATLSRILRTGDVAPGTGGALFHALPDVPAINAAGQVTVLAALRPGTGSPLVNLSNDTGLWTEVGGAGMKLLLREDQDIPGLPAGTKVGRFDSGCFATARLNAADGETAFSITMKGASTDSALLRAGVSGSAVDVEVVAREGTPAGSTGESFGFLNGDYTDAVRMDAQGNIVFGAILTPSQRTSLWYQPVTGGAPVEAFVAGDPAPDAAGATSAGSATFRSFDVPSMGQGGTFAFRGVLNADGDNTSNLKNDGIWRGSVAGGFTSILRRGDNNASRPGLFGVEMVALHPNVKAGNIYSGWLVADIGSGGAWLGWVDLGGDGIHPFPTDTYGIYTDLAGPMRLLISVGDVAPDIAGCTMAFIDHPVVGGAGQLAFIGAVSGGTSNASNNKGIWRMDVNGGTLKLVIRTGDTVSTTAGSKIIDDVDLPGSNLPEHQWETPVMDSNGRLLVYVTFTDGTNSQIIVE